MFQVTSWRIAHTFIYVSVATVALASNPAFGEKETEPLERYALAKQLPKCRGVTAVQLEVKGESSKFVVPVNSKIWTTIKVPNGIQKMFNPPDEGFVIRRGSSTIDVAPKSDTPAGGRA